MINDEHTTDLPIRPIQLAPLPHARRGRLETMGLVSGSVLSGALIVAILWWINDPHMPRAATANIIFMTLTSGAVVGLIYAIVRACVRASVERIITALDGRVLPTIEIQAQSLRAQHRDTQWQIEAVQDLVRLAGVARDKRMEGWLTDIGKGVMAVGEKATEGVAAGQRERADLSSKLDMIGRGVAAVAGLVPRVAELEQRLERLATTSKGLALMPAQLAALRQSRATDVTATNEWLVDLDARWEGLTARQDELAKRVEEGAAVRLDLPNGDVYELGKQLGREEAMRERGEEDPKR